MIYSPEEIKSNSVPKPVIANAVISETIDTQQRRILGQYQFGSTGSIQVGKYESGVTGDIRISPTGILGRDSTGDTTFSIDATTGDAYFKGTIVASAGSEVTDLVVKDHSLNKYVDFHTDAQSHRLTDCSDGSFIVPYQLATDPTGDILDGAIYYNTTQRCLKVFIDDTWKPIETIPTISPSVSPSVSKSPSVSPSKSPSASSSTSPSSSVSPSASISPSISESPSVSPSV
jgi:hypothetical protein